jgi:hypothetical protein
MPEMRLQRSLLAALLSLLAACHDEPRLVDAPTPSPVASGDARPRASAAPPVTSAVPASSPTTSPPTAHGLALDDATFGRLVRDLSESSGDFPSDNLVSNETSYLHVASALLDPKRQGKAYVGVGPEQSFAYVGMMKPAIAFVIDIRRENLVLHLVYKTLLETASSRAELAALLTSRVPMDLPADTSPASLASWVRSHPADPARLTVTRDAVRARAKALGVTLDARDEKHLQAVLETFRDRGLDLHYTMKGSSRKYPTLAELSAEKDDTGALRGLLGSDETFREVSRLQRENRIVPLVADFSGKNTFPRLGDHLRSRNLSAAVVYTSNVEQYLFSPGGYAQWIANVRALPLAEDAVVVRVHFDQGEKHPAQRAGHRTTSLVEPVSAFLARSATIQRPRDVYRF